VNTRVRTSIAALFPAVLLALSTAAVAASPSRYTFSWPVGPDAPAPRGGTTRGPDLVIDSTPSKAWLALQASGLSAFERDRRAILAMAGSYRVAFDFLEIAAFSGDGSRPRPYQSWGTERVYVDRDEGRLISLVHILDMRVVDKDGKLSEPMVTKHWRQDWRYEPRYLVEYQGDETWQRRNLASGDARGRWSQTVYQVDESPRYASVGRWEHNASFSSWISGDTARPLPRREWSVRKDYQLLQGENRHTIVPTGWIQEENNLKAASPGSALPFLGREYGVARYETIKDPDFAAADSYYAASQQYWREVVTAWDEIWARHKRVKLNASVDQSGAYAALFEQADEFAKGALTLEAARTAIRDALKQQGAIAD